MTVPAGGSKKQIWNEKALYTTGFFTTGTLSGIVTSVNKGEARKGKKDMITVQFALSYKEHMELRQSSFQYLDGLCARSFKAKWDNSMIL